MEVPIRLKDGLWAAHSQDEFPLPEAIRNIPRDKPLIYFAEARARARSSRESSRASRASRTGSSLR